MVWADLLDDDRREALGRLVQHQKPRAGMQDSCDRQHLLLAARQFGALAVEPLLEIGKQFEDLIQRQPRPSATTGGNSRFSRTSRLAKMPRSSGQKATPMRAIRSEDARPISCSLKRIAPVRLPMIPITDFSVVVLPAPLRPSNVTTSPAFTLKSMP